MGARELQPSPSFADTIDELVGRWGGAASAALFEPGIELFRDPRFDGAIAFRRAGGYAIAFGEPLCAAHRCARLSAELRAACAAEGLAIVWVAVGPGFAELEASRGAAVLEFATNLVLGKAVDPRRGRGGRRGRKLRNRLRRAEEAGIVVGEYSRAAPDPVLERELAAFAQRWLAAHGGPLSLGHVQLFEHAALKRWMIARGPAGIVGVLAMLRAPALGGWLVDDFLSDRDGPPGASELLVVRAVELLGTDETLVFGPTARAELGIVLGLHAHGERFARRVYHLVGRAAGFARHAHYAEKFGVAQAVPSFLVFDPPALQTRGLLSIVRAFRAHARPLALDDADDG